MHFSLSLELNLEPFLQKNNHHIINVLCDVLSVLGKTTAASVFIVLKLTFFYFLQTLKARFWKESTVTTFSR